MRKQLLAEGNPTAANDSATEELDKMGKQRKKECE
jgi:hypothetical protein